MFRIAKSSSGFQKNQGLCCNCRKRRLTTKGQPMASMWRSEKEAADNVMLISDHILPQLCFCIVCESLSFDVGKRGSDNSGQGAVEDVTIRHKPPSPESAITPMYSFAIVPKQEFRRKSDCCNACDNVGNLVQHVSSSFSQPPSRST